MTFKLGLTGSIGMGKSTTAQMFADAGCAIWDADAAVHRLYGENGAAVAAFKEHLPEAVLDYSVSREKLKMLISKDPSILKRVEQIVHPLVAQDRKDFVASAQADILVFDIPLLFETGGNSQMNAVACVTVADDVQEKRVMDRGTMTREQFLMIKEKQMPNSEKLAQSDYVITTDTLEHTLSQVQHIVADIRGKIKHA